LLTGGQIVFNLCMISRKQVRAARALLGMEIAELARRACVSPTTVTRFENGLTQPIKATLTVLQLTLEREGIEFLNHDAPGVWLRRRT
jgi:transcriptional regulator with XRE-family HTH domain